MSWRHSFACFVVAWCGILGVARANDVVITALIGFATAGEERLLVRDHPNPFTLRIENRSGTTFDARLDLAIGEAFGVESPFISRDVSVSPGVTKQIGFLVPGLSMLRGTLRVRTGDAPWNVNPRGFDELDRPRLGVRDATIAFGLRTELVAYPNVLLYLGGNARQLATALPDFRQARPMTSGSVRALHLDRELVRVGFLEADEVPDTWLAYEGLSAILCCETDFAQMTNPAQGRALREWVRYGGRLVLLAARQPERLQEPQLSAWLPFSFAGTTLGPYLTDARESIESTFLRFDLGPEAFGVVSTRETLGKLVDETRVRTDVPFGTPNVCRVGARIGLGSVACACFDPFAYDRGEANELLRAMRSATGLPLERAKVSREASGDRGDPYHGFGGGVFYSLLRNTNVMTPSLSFFILIGIAFVLLVGPFDYVLLKRFRKLRYSPITLVGYAVLFSVASVAASFALFAPRREINRLAILDFVEDGDGTEWVSGFLYRGIYTPLGARNVLSLEGANQFDVLAREAVFDNPSFLDSTGSEAIEPQVFAAPGSQPLALDQPVNSFRCVATRCAGKPRGGIAVSVEATPGASTFTVIVHNGLSRPLENVLFVWGKEAAKLPDVPPGETVRGHCGRLPGTTGKSLRDLGVHGGRFTGFRQMDRRRSAEEAFPATLVDALRGSTVRDLSEQYGVPTPEHTALDGLPAPWDLSNRLGETDGVLLATTRDYPLEDRLQDEVNGFTHVFVRKVVSFANAMPSQAGQEPK